ncbi:MAG: 50S ribosomal protein L24 [Actinomycetota bacterium]
MPRIKKGDLVQVITGAKADRGGDRGKQGKVLALDLVRNRVIVEGVNMVTKHNKVGQTDKGGKTGGIETKEAPIHISNVALVDPSTKKPTRFGAKVETVTKAGKSKTVRTRIAVRSGKEI